MNIKKSERNHKNFMNISNKSTIFENCEQLIPL